MASDAGQVIPLSVIGGFLGSGKTTLINNILQLGHNIRTVVLVNDFGSINVDEQLIAAVGGETVALTNGCVCCSIGDDLTEALIRASELQPMPDWIVIEASGVADPRQIAQVGVVDPILIIDGVIVLADVAEVKKLAGDQRLADTIHRQLRAADVLLLNKADLVSRSQVAEVQEWLEAVVPSATIRVTVNADIPWALVRGPTKYSLNHRNYETSFQENMLGTTDKHETGHNRQFSTWTYQTTRRLRKETIRRLLRDMPPQVLRAKGFVRLDSDPDKETIVQFAGQSRSLKLSGNEAPEVSRIVFIGFACADEFASVRARLEEAET